MINCDIENYSPCHVREMRNYILFDLGQNIKWFREYNGETQDELAEALNVTKSTISKFENGYKEVPSSFLPFIAARYKVNISTLYGERFHPSRISEYDLFFEMVINAMRLSEADLGVISEFAPVITGYFQNFMSTKAENSFDIYYAFTRFLDQLKVVSNESVRSDNNINQLQDIFKLLQNDMDKIKHNNYHKKPSIFFQEIYTKLQET